MSGPRIGELFAGYGGLGMGVQAVLGGDIAWYSEIDKGALKILSHRFPDVPNIGDITTVDWSQVEPVDILTGGSPCQDLSHAGKRAGMIEGTRSNLWVAMREAIAQLRPKLVIWENVRGAYSAEADSDLVTDPRLLADTRRRDGQPVLRALGRVLGDLSDLGYVGGWHGLRAADVGAPHGRFRVFVVAADTRRGGGREGAQLRSGPRATASGWQAGRTGGHHLRGVDSPLLSTPQARDHKGVPGDGFNTACLARDVSLLPTPAVNDMGEGKTVEKWDDWTADMQARHGNGNGYGKSLAIEAQRLLPAPNAGDAKQGYVSAEDHAARSARKAAEGIHLQDDLPQVVTTTERWGDYAAAIARWERALGRPAPAPTMTSTKGNLQLSPAFVEWLMGLPAGWVTDAPDITRNEALKGLGNGVVPQQAEAAVRFLLAQERAA